MDGSERRGRARRRWTTRAAPLVVLALALGAGGAGASPLDEPFVGGLSFSGPTSGNIAAIYWNPAALGLVRGFQLMVSPSFRSTTIGMTRTGIDPETGQALPPQSATAHELDQPVAWPLGPGGFVGISSDLGGDRFALGLATYMPFLEQVHFPLSPTGGEPSRYHALTIDLRNLALVPALSIRFGDNLRIGVSTGFLFSTGHITFAEDTALDRGTSGLDANCGVGGNPCHVENTAADARYDVASGNGLGDAKFSVTLGAGAYYRWKRLELGLSYQSRPIGSDVPGVEVAAPATTITLPPRDANASGVPLTCANGQSGRCVFGDIAYRLPDVVIGGATWHVAPGVEVTAMVRWLWLHVHDRIDVRLSAPTLDQAQLPQHIVLYRGFHDVWDSRLRVSYWWRERIRVGAMVRFETSAVDANAVNAAAVDGFKVEPVLLAEVRIARRFWLGGGYGLTIMPAVNVTDSSFDPTFATACVDPPPMGAGGDIRSTACQARDAGRARPSADGHYTLFQQDFGLTLTARF
jgi:long-subunit fatty acid transport protein